MHGHGMLSRPYIDFYSGSLKQYCDQAADTSSKNMANYRLLQHRRLNFRYHHSIRYWRTIQGTTALFSQHAKGAWKSSKHEAES